VKISYKLDSTILILLIDNIYSEKNIITLENVQTTYFINYEIYQYTYTSMNYIVNSCTAPCKTWKNYHRQDYTTIEI